MTQSYLEEILFTGSYPEPSPIKNIFSTLLCPGFLTHQSLGRTDRSKFPSWLFFSVNHYKMFHRIDSWKRSYTTISGVNWSRDQNEQIESLKLRQSVNLCQNFKRYGTGPNPINKKSSVNYSMLNLDQSDSLNLVT